MKVIKNFMWNAGYQIFAILVPLITIPYVSRVLGPQGIGINAYTNSIVQYFVLFGNLGINIYGSREIAYAGSNLKKRSKVFWELFLLKLISVGISSALFIGVDLAQSQYRLYLLAQGVLLFGSAFDVSWFFQGIENFKVTVLRSVFVKLVSIFLIFTLVKDTSGTIIYILIVSMSQLLGYLTLWPYVFRELQRISFASLSLKRHLLPAISLLVPQIATQVYLQLNKTMLGMMKGVNQAGYYDNSDKIVRMVLAVATATGTVLLPHVASNFARGDMVAVKKSLVVSTHFIMVITAPMMFGLIAIAPEFTIAFFGDKFTTVGPLIQIESLIIVLIGISNAIGVQYLLPTNQLRAYSGSVILGSIVNVLFNVPLIIRFGVSGAVTATVISELFVTGYQLYRIHKQVNIGLLFFEVWKYFFAGLVMGIMVLNLKYIIGVGILGVSLRILIGVFVYLMVLLLLKPKYIISNLKKLIG